MDPEDEIICSKLWGKNQYKTAIPSETIFLKNNTG